jgi:GMP reductase
MPKIDFEPKLDFEQVLIRPKRSELNSRNEVELKRTFHFKSGSQWTGVPVIAANMSTTGTFELYQELSKHFMLTALHKFYKLEDFKKYIEKNGNLNPEYFMISTGISDADFQNLTQIASYIQTKWICIDIANGYISKFLEFCKKVRKQFPNHIIVAGNVATREMVETLLIEADVDIVKVGIGPGSVCTTRKKTGVGMPQLSCVLECADAAHGVGKYIVSDGGITCPGDMSKAFCGGADFVMMGGSFAGHDENPGDIITKDNGKKYKIFYGMSSEHAMVQFYGKKNDYRSSEGKVVEVAYKGPIHNTILDYLGGVRSTCTYIGAKYIKHMPKCTTFELVSKQLNQIYS